MRFDFLVMWKETGEDGQAILHWESFDDEAKARDFAREHRGGLEDAAGNILGDWTVNLMPCGHPDTEDACTPECDRINYEADGEPDGCFYCGN
jgi:hypothetical protein